MASRGVLSRSAEAAWQREAGQEPHNELSLRNGVVHQVQADLIDVLPLGHNRSWGAGATGRTQEIGIRMALGAQVGRVRRRIMMQTMFLAAIGLAIGTLASIAFTQSLSGLLFGVTYGDPLTLLTAATVMLAVALLAGYLPAHRASRIDPMVALRVD